MAKPAPVSKVTVCSVCDLPWEDHTKNRKTAPTADVCIRLLKAEVAKRRYWPNQISSGSAAATIVPAFYGNVTPIAANG